MDTKKREFHVHIQMEAGDLWRFSMYHANRGYLGIFNLLFTLAALSQLIFRWRELTIPYRLLFLVCALMFTVWQPGLLYLKAKRQSKNQAMAQPMDMTFAEEGISVEQGGEQGEVTWDQVTEVRRAGGQLIIYLSRIRAYLVPDRCLGEEKEAFVEFLRQVLPKERRKRI